MKKITLFLFMLLSITGFAQKKQKIKGNKEVLIKKFLVPVFTGIEVGEHFEINLQKATDTTRVVIETDDNLFDVIHFNVDQGVLKFNTSMEIVKKKRLRITVFVPQNFNNIRLIEKGKVFNDEMLNLESLQMEALDKSRAELNLHIAKDLNLTGRGKANLDMEVYARKADIYLTENARIKGVVNIEDVNLKLDDHAKVDWEGNVNYLDLKIKNKAAFESEKLTIQKVDLKAYDKTRVIIKVNNKIDMKLSGKSETYLYGKPKTNLKSFEDNAVLYKK